MPHKPKPNINSQVRNGYSGAAGLMQNQAADNRLQATITANELKQCSNWVYGSTPHNRTITSKTKQLIGSTVVHTIRRLKDDKTTDLIMDDGEIIQVADLERKGITVSAFLQLSKYKQ